MIIQAHRKVGKEAQQVKAFALKAKLPEFGSQI